MNFRVDIMVIGDSKAGHEILDKLASSKSLTKLAFISQEFKSATTHNYVNVKYFKDKVEYVSYRHRLFCCYLKNGDNVFSTHLVIASGLDYEPLVINGEQVPCVFNTVDNIPSNTKDQSALVIYNQESDIKLAIEVAKKYKQVYFCAKETAFTESLSAANTKKLDKAENLVILPNTSIQKVILDKNGLLQNIIFDNYSEINCSAIFVKTATISTLKFIPKKILSIEDGYPVIKENCESELVPGCFVVGNCLKKYTKTMEQKLIDTILKDF